MLHLVHTRYHKITIIFKMLESETGNLIFGKSFIYLFYIIIYTFIHILFIFLFLYTK